jgi:hypothetical protein
VPANLGAWGLIASLCQAVTVDHKMSDSTGRIAAGRQARNAPEEWYAESTNLQAMRGRGNGIERSDGHSSVRNVETGFEGRTLKSMFLADLNRTGENGAGSCGSRHRSGAKPRR